MRGVDPWRCSSTWTAQLQVRMLTRNCYCPRSGPCLCTNLNTFGILWGCCSYNLHRCTLFYPVLHKTQSFIQYIGCIDHTISENGIFREFGRPVLKWLLGYNYWELYRCSPHSILVGSFHQWWGYLGTTVTIVRVIHGTWRFSTDVGCVGLHSIATHVF